MEFKLLRWKNFGSYGDYWTEFPLDKPGLFLIVGDNQDEGGSNGAGKSTVIDVLTWVLYGAPIKEVSAAGVINWLNDKNTEAELYFTKDGDNYMIRRFRKHSAHGAQGVHIFINDEDKTESAININQEIINKIMKIDKDGFVNSIVFSSDNFINFIGLKPTKKRETLESFLNVDLVSGPLKKVKEVLKDFKIKLEALQKQRESVSTLLLRSLADYRSHKTKLETFEDDRTTKLTQSKRLLDKYKHIDIDAELEKLGKLKQTTDELKPLLLKDKSLNEARLKVLTDLKNYESKSNAFETDRRSRIAKSKKLLDQYVNVDVDAELEKHKERAEIKEAINKKQHTLTEYKSGVALIKQNIVNLNTKIADFKSSLEAPYRKLEKFDSLGNKCPECESDVDPSHVKKHKAEINAQIQTIEANIGKLGSEKEEILAKLQKIEAAVSSTESKINELTKRERELRTDYSENELGEIRSKVEKLKSDIDSAEKEENAYAELVVETTAKLDELTAEYKEISEEVQRLSEELKKHTSEYTEVQLNEIKANIGKLTEAIDVLENQPNPYVEITETAEQNVNQLQGELDVLDKDIGEIQTEVPYYKFWESSFGEKGIKVFILENIIPVLNERINYYLDTLFTSGTYKLLFDKHLNENLIISNIAGREINSNSNGEKRRIDLAISLAIFDLLQLQHGIVTNVRFFDEVFDVGLDAVGVNKAFELLASSKVPATYVISHKNTLMENFDHTISVVKKNGFSRLRKPGDET